MTRMYWIKRIPPTLKAWFENKFKPSEGFIFEYYKYFNHDKTITYYGCMVKQNGELFSYSNQGQLHEFI
jgi:hypothetical protein